MDVHLRGSAGAVPNRRSSGNEFTGLDADQDNTSQDTLSAMDLLRSTLENLLLKCERSPTFHERNTSLMRTLLLANTIPAFTDVFLHDLMGRLVPDDLMNVTQLTIDESAAQDPVSDNSE